MRSFFIYSFLLKAARWRPDRRVAPNITRRAASPARSSAQLVFGNLQQPDRTELVFVGKKIAAEKQAILDANGHE